MKRTIKRALTLILCLTILLGAVPAAVSADGASGFPDVPEGAWYTQYLSDNGLTSVTPPDGGVTISLLGVPYADCPNTETMWQGTKNKKTFWWFDLAGYNLTVITPTDGSYAWFNVFRNTEK